MTLTTATVNSLLSISESAFQSLVDKGIFSTPTFCAEFDSSGTAENGNPFYPGTPCYFNATGK